MKKLNVSLNNKKTAVILWILSAILSFIVAELFNTNNIFTINFFRILINILIILIINLFIYSITGKIRLSAILSTIVIFILSLSNYAIYCFRGTPLDPLDILSIGTGISVAASYKLAITFYLVFAVVLFVITLFVCSKIKYNPRFGKKSIVVRRFFIHFNNNIGNYFI